VVFKYFGQLCLVLAVLSLVPLAMSLIFGDTPISLRYGIVIGGLAASGFGLVQLRAPSKV
jgi:trk system potassium uptake protein TrkH